MAANAVESNRDIFLECFWHHICLSREPCRPREVHQGKAQGGCDGLSPGGRLVAGTGGVAQHTYQTSLDDFATRLFMALPPDLKTISTHEGRNLPEQYSRPYSISQMMLVCSNLPNDLDEDSTNYLGIAEGASLKPFYMAILRDYIKAASRNHSSCEICQRHRFKLTKHHLVPRVMHALLQRQGSCGEHHLKQVAWLCRGCHEFIHRRIKPDMLAQKYPSVELLLRRPDVRDWAKSFRNFVRKVG